MPDTDTDTDIDTINDEDATAVIDPADAIDHLTGLKPQWLHQMLIKQSRLEKLVWAINSHTQRGIAPRPEWFEEIRQISHEYMVLCRDRLRTYPERENIHQLSTPITKAVDTGQGQ